MTHNAENDAPVGYPTRWPKQRMACRNPRCRVEVYVGTPVVPFTDCPLCLQVGRVIPPEVGAL